MTVEMIPTMIAEQWEIILPEHRAARGDEWKTWERERLESMYEHVGVGDVVYDIGAEEGDFPGLYALWGASVALFEPNPRVWPNIRAIWEANAFPDPLGCFVGFAGPSDTPAVDQLQGTGWHFGEWPTCAYGPLIGDHGFMVIPERPDVPVIRLDTAASLITPPTAITIDVEGAEFVVLQGATAVLKGFRPKVWVSVHPDAWIRNVGGSAGELFGLMDSLDYEATLLADTHEAHWYFAPREGLL